MVTLRLSKTKHVPDDILMLADVQTVQVTVTNAVNS